MKPPLSRHAQERRQEGLDLRMRYDAGATIREIVESTGLSHGTVVNRLRAAGTVMRTPQEARRHRGAAKRRALLAAGLRARYEQGATLSDLVNQCGRSARTIRRLLQEADTTFRTPLQAHQLRKVTATVARQQLMATLRNRYEAGQSVPALAADHGCSLTTIYRLLRAAGTPMRPPQRPGPPERRADHPP